MSENYEYRSYTRPQYLSPEERQRQQIRNAVNAAMSDANAQYQQTVAFINQKHNEEMSRLNKKIESLEDDIRNKAKMRQKQYAKLREEYEKSINKAMSDAEKKRQQDRKQYEKDLKDAVDGINDHIDDLRKSTRKAIDAANESIKKLHDETFQALGEQQKQINDIVVEYHTDKAKANAIRKTLTKEYKSQFAVVETKNHKKYAPGRLENIATRVQNINAFPDDAAIAILHGCIINLFSVENELEKNRLEYMSRHEVTMDAANKVLEQMKKNKEMITFVDQDNNILYDENGEVAKVDFDYWTDGEYGKLEVQLEKIKDELKNGFDDSEYTLTNLDDALQKIEDINKRQNELVNYSIERGNASMIREDLAYAAIDKLKRQGFQVVECGFENDDKRKAYFAKMKDKKTSKILLVVNPITNNNNQLVINTIDSEFEEPDLIQQGEAIKKYIYESGYEVSQGTCKGANAFLNEIYDYDFLHGEIPDELKERAGLKRRL